MNKKHNPLRYWCDKNLITVRKLAAQSGIPYRTLLRIWKDETLGSRLTILRLCKATNGDLRLEDFGHER
jgi:DNA-binding Xre family transcriptional regulator